MKRTQTAFRQRKSGERAVAGVPSFPRLFFLLLISCSICGCGEGCDSGGYSGSSSGGYYYGDSSSYSSSGSDSHPAPPTDLSVDVPNDPSNGDRLQLKWTRSIDDSVDRYNIYRTPEGGAEIQLDNDSSSLSGYLDTGLQKGVVYSYRVDAVSTNGLKSAYTSTVSGTPVDNKPPPQPTELNGTAESPQKVLLTWNGGDDPDVHAFHVYRKAAGSDDFTKVNSSAITDATFTDTTVESNNQYRYKMTAVDDVGNESEESTLLFLIRTPRTLAVLVGHIFAVVLVAAALLALMRYISRLVHPRWINFLDPPKYNYFSAVVFSYVVAVALLTTCNWYFATFGWHLSGDKSWSDIFFWTLSLGASFVVFSIPAIVSCRTASCPLQPENLVLTIISAIVLGGISICWMIGTPVFVAANEYRWQDVSAVTAVGHLAVLCMVMLVTYERRANYDNRVLRLRKEREAEKQRKEREDEQKAEKQRLKQLRERREMVEQLELEYMERLPLLRECYPRDQFLREMQEQLHDELSFEEFKRGEARMRDRFSKFVAQAAARVSWRNLSDVIGDVFTEDMLKDHIGRHLNHGRPLEELQAAERQLVQRLKKLYDQLEPDATRSRQERDADAMRRRQERDAEAERDRGEQEARERSQREHEQDLQRARDMAGSDYSEEQIRQQAEKMGRRRREEQHINHPMGEH